MKESLEEAIVKGNMKDSLSDQLRFAPIPALSYMQPERSKREDLSKEDYDLADFMNGKIGWDELKMRCSEHDSNVVREVQ